MFGIDKQLDTPINWLTIDKILLLCLCICAACFALYFAVRTKNTKRILITKIVFAGLLFCLEIGRMIWFTCRAGYYNMPLNVWTTINFHMCSMMVWVNILTLILSIIIKKQNKFVDVLYNIIFGIGMLGGIITFVYPQFINGSYSIFHFRNLQSIITHIILIVNPIFLYKTTHFEIKMKNYWIIPLTFVAVGSISSFASICGGANFAFAYRCELFTAFKLYIRAPWHILIVMLILCLIIFIIYLVICLIHKKKNNKPLFEVPNLFELITMISIPIYTALHMLTFRLVYRTIFLAKGLYMLIPFVVEISFVVCTYWICKKKNKLSPISRKKKNSK